LQEEIDIVFDIDILPDDRTGKRGLVVQVHCPVRVDVTLEDDFPSDVYHRAIAWSPIAAVPVLTVPVLTVAVFAVSVFALSVPAPAIVSGESFHVH
jgi:hypothetical protein